MPEAEVWRVRVDTGGTFTDAWGRSPDGTERRCKILSDGNLRLGVSQEGQSWWKLDFAGLELEDGFLCGWETPTGDLVQQHVGGRVWVPGWEGNGTIELRSGEEAPVVAARILTRTSRSGRLPDMDFRVATTRGTNALLERKGARLALFVSEGFEDLLLCGDQRRGELFSLAQPPVKPLAEAVIPVAGRLSADGHRLRDLDESAVRKAARQVLRNGCKVAAVALLHSWKSPEDEEQVEEWLLDEGFEQVTLSSGVAPLVRLLPRAETAVTDAFLAPVMRRFVERISEPLNGREAWLMTSAGGMVPAARYLPKDSLLSGPAGGLIGAAELGRAAGFPKLLTFDMGGTSTDVARVDGPFSYRREQQIGPARVVAPALKIETVAAGGGSICRWRDGSLEVGPESAGSDPGPACYGRGGPLTLTDVNLLLGLMDTRKAGIPLDREAAVIRFEELRETMRSEGEDPGGVVELLEGIRAIGVETMAEAIRSVSVREGTTVEDHALLAFGGAGPQHACAIASRLGIGKVLVPADAGLLSAWGLERAVRQEQGVRQVLALLEEVDLEPIWNELEDECRAALGVVDPVVRRLADLRLLGQDSTIEVEAFGHGGVGLKGGFSEAYRQLFGYAPPASKPVEVVSLRLVCEEASDEVRVEQFGDIESIGPLLIQDRFSTCVVPAGWSLRRGSRGTVLLESAGTAQALEGGYGGAVRAGLFRSRFEGLLDAMGEVLRRTALSTNVKERLDYSCALLDDDGRLVASAPHVPVHLGALGVCVRETAKRLPMAPGDIAITNHPAAGGSHLPDITVVAPVHDSEGRLIGYVANRAHHAELGGMAPGSMPAAARCLAEEGVVIEPMLLLQGGQPRFGELESLLREASYPSRRPADNLADVEAQLAACHLGRKALLDLVEASGSHVVREELVGIVARSGELMKKRLAGISKEARVLTSLDDGTELKLALRIEGGSMLVDFGGSGPIHAGNLNATPAIVRSVTLYVLRLWLGEDVPLNEGLLEPVDLRIPESFLNPVFDADPCRAAAVVGGNVETSQRLTDVLLEAFGMAANGPGSMNNFLFGDGGFGYYETLAGGAGAGPGFHGASGRHVHMTNTALTDPELLEHRYPVRVWRHGIRRASGGSGEFSGGDGIVREIEFLSPLTVSFLTQRRLSRPRGLEGGMEGKRGKQSRVSPNGEVSELPPACTYEAEVGERVVIETPGGGGWGGRFGGSTAGAGCGK